MVLFKFDYKFLYGRYAIINTYLT